MRNREQALSEKVPQRRSLREDLSEKIYQRRSIRGDPLEKIPQRRSIREDLSERSLREDPSEEIHPHGGAQAGVAALPRWCGQEHFLLRPRTGHKLGPRTDLGGVSMQRRV